MATLFNTRIFETYQGLIKTIDNAVITASLKELTDGSGNQTGLYINTAGDFKVSNILEWGSLKDTGTGVTITRYVTSTDGIENFDNNTSLPTTAAVKLYVDTKFATSDTLQEVLSFGNTTGGNDIVVSASDDITFTDSSKAIFGAGSDLQIYHDGSHSYINDAGTGALKILASQLEINNSANTENIATFTENGAVQLFYDNSKKFETTTTGVTITGRLSGLTDPTLAQDAATKSYVDALDAGSDLDFKGDNGTAGDVNLNTQRLDILGTVNQITTVSSGQSLTIGMPTNITISGIVNATTFNGDVTGNVTGDLTGTASLIDVSNTATNQNQYLLQSAGTLGSQTVFGDSNLYFNPVANLLTVDGSADFTGNLNVTGNITGGGGSFLPLAGGTMTGDTIHNDNVKSIYGTGSDLQIYHDGTHAVVNNTTGNVYLSSLGAVFLRTNTNETSLLANANGNVELYYNNSKKFETTNTGISVTGNGVYTGNVYIETNNKLFLGDSSNVQLFYDGTDGRFVNTTGDLKIDQSAVTKSIVFRVSDANSLDTTALTISRNADASFGRDVTIAGDLTVNGTTTTVNSQTLAVVDPLIQLAKDNTANSLDIGLYGDYNDGTDRFLGLFSDASDSNKFKLFKGTTVEPTTTVDIGGAGYEVADLLVGDFEASTGVFNGGNGGNGQIDLFRTSGANIRIQAQSALGRIGTSSDHNFILFTNDTTRLTIDNTGNFIFDGDVDITNHKLQITSSAPEIILSVPTGGLDSRIYNDGSGNFIIGNGTNSATPTTALTIDSSQNTTLAGNLSLTDGSITIDDDDPYGGLLIEGGNAPGITIIDQTLNTCKAGIFQQSTTGNEGRLLIQSDIDNTGANSTIELSVDGTNALVLNSSQNATFAGDVITTGTSFIGKASTSSYLPDDGVFGGIITNGGGFKITTQAVDTLTLSAVGGNMTVRGAGNFGSRVTIENTTNLTTGVVDSLLIKTLSSGASITNGFGGAISFYLENTVYSAVNEVAKISVIETDTTAINDKMVFSVKDNNILAERLTLSGSEATFAGNVTINGAQNALTISTTDTDGPYAVWKNTTNATLGFVGNANSLASAGNTNFAVRATNDLVFASGGGTERMRIDSSGVVQVKNVSNPTIQLTNTDASLTSNQVIGSLDWYQSDPSGGGVGVINKISAINSSGFQGEADFSFQTGNTTDGLTEKMRITSGGNVGIGEDTPLVPLHISRDNASGENIALILDNNDTTVGAEVGMLFRCNTNSSNADYEILARSYGSNDSALVFESDGSVETFRLNKNGSQEWNMSNATVDISGSTGGNITMNNTTGTWAFRADGSSVNSATISSSSIILNEDTDVNGQLVASHGANYVARFVNTATSMSNNNYTFEVDSSSHNSNMSAAGAMAVDVNSGRAFTITGAGLVGIGLAIPQKTLDIAASTPTLRLTNTQDPLGDGTVGVIEFFTNDSSTGATRAVSVIECNNQAGSSVPGGDLVFKTSLGGSGSPVATEKLRIKDDGKVDISEKDLSINNVNEHRESFIATGNAAVSFDIDMKNVSASGQPFEVFVAFTHYSTAYGAMLHQAFYQRSTVQSDITLVHTYINQTSTNAGAWSVSYVDATTIRISKTAGAHASTGHGYLRVTQVKP